MFWEMILSAAVPLVAMSYPQLGEHFGTKIVVTSTGFVIARLLVAPDRRVDDCEILHNDFSTEIGEEVCRELRQKRVEAPALGPAGKEVHGTVIHQIAVSYGRERELILREEPVIDVLVSRLPPEVGDSMTVGVRVFLNEMGYVTACEPETSELSTYTEIACREVSLHPLRVRHDRNGKPVPYLTYVNIEFSESVTLDQPER